MTHILAFVLLLAPFLGMPVPAARAASSAAIGGEHFLDGAGRPVFVLGANYEGPADRAWQMWEDTLFDRDLIGQDFRRARAANLSVLRVFVQRPLASDVLAGKWS